MPTTFARPVDNVSSTAAGPGRPAGASTAALSSGSGALFGSPTPDDPIRVTFVARTAVDGNGFLVDRTRVSTFLCIGRTGDVLTGLSLESGPDLAYVSGDYVAILIGAETVAAIQRAINALESTPTLPSQAGQVGKFLRTDGTSAGWAVVDLSGYASDAAVVHKSGAETIDGAKTFSSNISLQDGNRIVVSGGGNIGVGGSTDTVYFIDNQNIMYPGGKLLLRSGAAGNVPLTVQLATSQTANAIEVKSSTGSVLAALDATGSVSCGSITANTSLTSHGPAFLSRVEADGSQTHFYIQNQTTGGDIQFYSQGGIVSRSPFSIGTTGEIAASSVTLTVQLATSQSANAIEVKSSTGSVVASIDSGGTPHFGDVFSMLSTVSLWSNATFVGLGGGGLGPQLYLHLGDRVATTQESQFCWSSVSLTGSGTPDTGLARASAGVVKITDGSTGYGSLIVGKTSSNNADLLSLNNPDASGAGGNLSFFQGSNRVGKISTHFASRWQLSIGTYLQPSLMTLSDFGRVSIGPTPLVEVFPASFIVESSSATDVCIVAKMATSQTADALQIQSSTGIVLTRISSNGSIAVNGLNTSGYFLHINGGPAIYASGVNVFVAGGANQIPVTIKGTTSQTADLTQWQDSTGSVLASIGATGGITVPSVQTNTIHAPGGSLNIDDGAGGNAILGVGAGGYVVAGLFEDYGGHMRLVPVANIAQLGANFQLQWRATDSVYDSSTTNVGINGQTPNVLTITDGSSGIGAIACGSNTASTVGLTLTLATSQTANAIEVKSVTGSVVASIDSGGNISVSPGSRKYTFGTFDAGGSFLFSRSDASGGGFLIQPELTYTNLSSKAGPLILLNGGSPIIFSPAEGGGSNAVQIGRRYFDSSTACGASLECWPSSTQTTPALCTVVPGGGTYEFKVMRGGNVSTPGAFSPGTLADANAPVGSIYLGSDHDDGGGFPKLCRMTAGGAVPIG